MRAFAEGVLAACRRRAGSAPPRCSGAICCGSLALANRLAVFRDALLGERHHLDHALIGFARVVAEGEDAVLVEDEAFDLRVLVEHLGRFFRQREARHDVGHEAEPLAIDLRAQLGRVRLVDQAEHRGGVGVVDEFRRQEGMQQRFDRRARAPADRSDWRAARAPSRRRTAPRARASVRSGSSRTAGMPAGSIAAMSQPEPLTHSTATSSPRRSRAVVFTEVLPPPCSTSLGSRPSRRVE